MSNETIEDALCDMYDIRERSKVHKFSSMQGGFVHVKFLISVEKKKEDQ